ncbi:agrin [Biomphalaria glabrata]
MVGAKFVDCGAFNINGRQRVSACFSRGIGRPFVTSMAYALIVVCVFLANVELSVCNNQECVSLSPEQAARLADIVVSGTVRKVMPDRDSSTSASRLFKGQIEIKRVFKGEKLLDSLFTKTPSQLWHKLVLVKGFGDPSICRSSVQEKDTKIFMLQLNSKGELTLNSSILPLILLNLDYVDAIVHSEYHNFVFCHRIYSPTQGNFTDRVAILNKHTNNKKTTTQ